MFWKASTFKIVSLVSTFLRFHPLVSPMMEVVTGNPCFLQFFVQQDGVAPVVRNEHFFISVTFLMVLLTLFLYMIILRFKDAEIGE